MAVKLGLEVELMQADLLSLQSWERRFDFISCTGVWHHMADPIAGWKVICQLLAPGGVMKIALYSERARHEIVTCQRWLAERRLGVREGRHQLQQLPEQHPARASLQTRDFFYFSGCRDLLFHPQEHRFTPLQLRSALAQLGLDFIGFELWPSVRHSYQSMFPQDPDRTDLRLWESYEELHPKTFLGMYQFWCKKSVQA